MRVYEVGAGPAGGYFDVPVMLEARYWYVNVNESGRTYRCELGLVLPDWSFIGIVKTNEARLPEGRVSGEMDEKWMAVQPDFEKLLELAGVEYIGKGSGEVAKSLAQRWETLKAVYSRSSSWSGTPLPGMERAAAEERRLRLAGDCELILYGATEPGARVAVSGRRIALSPDGTFSMRLGLPDGETDLPVEALSADGLERRSLRITVDRRTMFGAEAALEPAVALKG